MKWSPLYLVFFVFLVDQITKILIIENIEKNIESISIITDIFNLRYVENWGMAFGLFSEVSKELKDILFNSLTIIAIGIIIYFYNTTSYEKVLIRHSFSLVLGGAFGNFTDKVLGYLVFEGEWRLFYGRVVDFIDLGISNYRWPTFNFADVAITVGILILFFNNLKKEKKIKKDFTKKNI